MLIIISIITAILGMLFIIGIVDDKDGLASISGFLLFIVAAFGWILCGCLFPVTYHMKSISKEKYELLIGEDKVVVTNLFTKTTKTFKDAKTYNIITNKKDKYYFEISNENMYGVTLEAIDIRIEDLRFLNK